MPFPNVLQLHYRIMEIKKLIISSSNHPLFFFIAYYSIMVIKSFIKAYSNHQLNLIIKNEIKSSSTYKKEILLLTKIGRINSSYLTNSCISNNFYKPVETEYKSCTYDIEPKFHKSISLISIKVTVHCYSIITLEKCCKNVSLLQQTLENHCITYNYVSLIIIIIRCPNELPNVFSIYVNSNLTNMLILCIPTIYTFTSTASSYIIYIHLNYSLTNIIFITSTQTLTKLTCLSANIRVIHPMFVIILITCYDSYTCFIYIVISMLTNDKVKVGTFFPYAILFILCISLLSQQLIINRSIIPYTVYFIVIMHIMFKHHVIINLFAINNVLSFAQKKVLSFTLTLIVTIVVCFCFKSH